MNVAVQFGNQIAGRIKWQPPKRPLKEAHVRVDYPKLFGMIVFRPGPVYPAIMPWMLAVGS